MSLKNVQEALKLICLPPTRCEFGETSPTIVVQAAPFSLLVATMLLLTPLSLGIFALTPLLYQQRAGKKYAGKDVSHLFLKWLSNCVAPGATWQRGKVSLDRKREGASRLQFLSPSLVAGK